MKNISKFIVLSFMCASLVIAGAVNSSLADEKKTESKGQEVNFARGAKLWANRCASCHNMRDPKDLTDNQWKTVMTHMQIRAGLTGQDARDILEFLQKSN